MRYTDTYRLERIVETGRQLFDLLADEQIDRQRVIDDYRI